MAKRHETNEDIRRSIAEIEILIKETGDLRESLGLPRNRPAYFVDAAESRAMVERVRVVYEVLVSYQRIINDGKKLAPLPAETFAQHIDLLTLIKYSKDMLVSRYADGLLTAIRTIQDDSLTYEKVVTQVYTYLDYSAKFLEFSDDVNLREYGVYEGTAEELDDIIAEYQRYYDEEVAPQFAHEAEVFAEYEAEQAEIGGEAVE